MKTKVCLKCGIEKSIDCFWKRRSGLNALRFQCKKCDREYGKKYIEDNKEKIRKYNREYYRKNPEVGRKRAKKYYWNNIEKVRERGKNNYRNNLEYYKKYRENNLGYKREYEKNKRANDPQYKLNGSIARAICESLKGNKAGRHWEELVGYTLEQLKQRLELNFDENMNWQNYGSYWWVDHSKPQSLFNFTISEEQAFKDCWALCNLRPMEKMENIRKSNRF